MKEGAPVRFLLLLVAGWMGVRAATLSSDWWLGPPSSEAAIAEAPEVEAVAANARAPVDPRPAQIDPGPTPIAPVRHRMRTSLVRPRHVDVAAALPVFRSPGAPVSATTAYAPPAEATGSPQPVPPAPPQIAPHPSNRRWSGSAWLLARRDGGTTLAPGGVLGGSQAGARLLYRLNGDGARPLSLSARAYLPLRATAGAEAALGLDWRPGARLPVHLLIERRQRLGRDGRSAFAATLYGGGSARLPQHWRLDGYAQAGIVGTRSRDAFVDGALRLSRPLGPVEVGGGLWGAAQPGANRLDAGPQLTLPLRARDTTLRLSAEYRFRIADDARPASGPVLTLGVDF